MDDVVVKYEHHGRVVSVLKRLKGMHREHCLCWNHCKHFYPDSERNCPIAQKNFEFDVKWGVTTPVYECPEYEGEGVPRLERKKQDHLKE